MPHEQLPLNNKNSSDSITRVNISSANTIASMLDVLQKNYDIVKALADIDKSDTGSIVSDASTAFDEVSSINDNSNGNTNCQSSPVRLRRNSDPVTWPSVSRSQKVINDHGNVWHRLSDNISGCFNNIVEAFTETNEDVKHDVVEPQKLSAHALRRDIRRCLNSSKPYLEACVAFHDLLIWKSPLTSAMALFIYAHMFYHGYLWMTFLGMILMQLFLNYLSTQKNINIGLYFLPRRDVKMPRFELSGVNLVFDVARRAQLILEFFADIMEKLNNLFMWKRPEITKNFCLFIGFFFTMSLLCSTSTCFFIIGLILGLKTFITAYLYYRFPRMRNKLDIFSYFFFRIPNDLEKSVRRHSIPRTRKTKIATTSGQLEASCSLRNINIMSSVVETALLHTEKRSLTMGSDIKNFGEQILQRNITKSTDESPHKSLNIKDLQCPSINFSFSKSIEEDAPRIECVMGEIFATLIKTWRRTSPKPGEEGPNWGIPFSMATDLEERSCLIVDKNKSLSKRIACGTLLLTETEMLFRYNHGSGSAKEIVYMPFDELQKLTKVHSLTPVPGRAIEVHLETMRRPLHFVGISNRDEFFNAVLETAARGGIKISS